MTGIEKAVEAATDALMEFDTEGLSTRSYYQRLANIVLTVALPLVGVERGPTITQIIRDVAELPDRTSPEDQPEMMLVSCDELEGLLESRIPAETGSLICTELADAAERLLATTPQERNEPRIWFGRVDALKLAIKVARREIPHGAALPAQSGSVQCREDVAREPMKVALTVLCAARSGQSWHENMMKDFDAAIYGLRVALEALPHTGQPVEGWLGDVRKALSDYNADLADSEHNPDAPGDFAISALKKIECALSPAPPSPQKRDAEK